MLGGTQHSEEEALGLQNRRSSLKGRFGAWGRGAVSVNEVQALFTLFSRLSNSIVKVNLPGLHCTHLPRVTRVSPGEGPDIVPTCVRACAKRQDGLIHKEELIQALFNNDSHSLFSEQVKEIPGPPALVRLDLLAHPSPSPNRFPEG
jgi:hypothetical protein